MVEMKRIRITSQTGHFGEVLGIDDRLTQDIPPPSTILGILKVLFGEDIEDSEFVFGYTFNSKSKYSDAITIYKHTDKGYQRATKKSPVTSDCRSVETHYDCELLIYTDLNRELKMEYALCMGKSGNPARVELPIKEVKLIDNEGYVFNQFTPISVGTGKIRTVNMMTRFNFKLNSYDSISAPLRFNKKFEYNKNYDEELEHNIVFWEKTKEGVEYYD